MIMSPRIAVAALALALSSGCRAGGPPPGPSSSCTNVMGAPVEGLICRDEGLSALDRKLDEVYAEASKRVVSTHAADLAASQRAWTQGRDECWKSSDKRACIQQEYERRIAELQIGYGLVAGTAPVTFR